MPTFTKFTGINNVKPTERLADTELRACTNADIGLDGEITRRDGYTQLSELCHKNLFEASGFTLCTSESNLIAIAPNGDRTILYPGLGMQRVWYCALPDGRVTFATGLIRGITDGLTVTTWGVPLLEYAGTPSSVPGNLMDGLYRVGLAYVRESDGLEGGTSVLAGSYSLSGGIMLLGLPTLAGHRINVYLSSHNDDGLYLAGTTTGTSFAFAGKNDALVLPCRTEDFGPSPEGATITALWRGRVLTADGSTLWASVPHAHEHFDEERDFKQFSAPITLVQPVDDGVFVGTTTELAFLAGDAFDELSYRCVLDGPVVLGSGVSVPGEMISNEDQGMSGSAMVCIAKRMLVAGGNGGQVVLMTLGRYETSATEVAATFRVKNGIPQYIAIPQ